MMMELLKKRPPAMRRSRLGWPVAAVALANIFAVWDGDRREGEKETFIIIIKIKIEIHRGETNPLRRNGEGTTIHFNQGPACLVCGGSSNTYTLQCGSVFEVGSPVATHKAGKGRYDLHRSHDATRRRLQFRTTEGAK